MCTIQQHCIMRNASKHLAGDVGGQRGPEPALITLNENSQKPVILHTTTVTTELKALD